MDTEVEETEESGAAWRAKHEAAIAEARALREALAETFKYVKADDLAGVAPAEVKTKAAEIEAARKAERELIAREVLAERGLPVDDLDTVFQTLTQQPAAETVDSAAARIASLGSLPGTVPNPKAIPADAFGEDRIRAVLNAE